MALIATARSAYRRSRPLWILVDRCRYRRSHRLVPPLRRHRPPAVESSEAESLTTVRPAVQQGTRGRSSSSHFRTNDEALCDYCLPSSGLAVEFPIMAMRAVLLVCLI